MPSSGRKQTADPGQLSLCPVQATARVLRQVKRGADQAAAEEEAAAEQMVEESLAAAAQRKESLEKQLGQLRPLSPKPSHAIVVGDADSLTRLGFGKYMRNDDALASLGELPLALG